MAFGEVVIFGEIVVFESCCFQERWWILKILRFFGRFENLFWKYRNFRRYAGFALQLCGF